MECGQEIWFLVGAVTKSFLVQQTLVIQTIQVLKLSKKIKTSLPGILVMCYAFNVVSNPSLSYNTAIVWFAYPAIIESTIVFKNKPVSTTPGIA